MSEDTAAAPENRPGGAGYVYREELTAAVDLALATGRPLLVRGAPGTGKSALAADLARRRGWDLFEYDLTSGTETQDLLWQFDQVWRAADAQIGLRLQEIGSYVQRGVLWEAFTAGARGTRAVVLLENIDNLKPDTANELMGILGSLRFTVRDTGEIVSADAAGPLVVLTDGAERPLPYRVTSRCIIVALQTPDAEFLLRVAAAHGLIDDPRLAEQLLHEFIRTREDAFADGRLPPTTRDYLDALRAVRELGIAPANLMAWAQMVFVRYDDRPAHQPSAAAQGNGIFLCHSSGDKPRVRDLYNQLRADGFRPWLDAEDLLPGQDFDLEIHRVVREAGLVIVCLSRESINKSGYVQKELRFALDIAEYKPDGTTFIVPAKLEPCEVPARLQRYHWVNLYEQDGYERLLKTVRSVAG